MSLLRQSKVVALAALVTSSVLLSSCGNSRAAVTPPYEDRVNEIVANIGDSVPYAAASDVHKRQVTRCSGPKFEPESPRVYWSFSFAESSDAVETQLETWMQSLDWTWLDDRHDSSLAIVRYTKPFNGWSSEATIRVGTNRAELIFLASSTETACR
jgi:hypothetical protein